MPRSRASDAPDNAPRDAANAVRRVVARVRIPVRVDFAGGWSDVPLFSSREGGAVVNAAVALYVEGRAWIRGDQTRVEYGTSIPKGSGLGASAALDVAWLALTNALMGRTVSPSQLAEDAYRLEKLLGVQGGKQDQYAAALGGFNDLTFGPEDEPGVVNRLTLDPRVVAALEDSLVLCYTGTAHHSGTLHDLVWRPYLDGNGDVVRALRAIRDSVPAARDALVAGDLPSLAEIMTANREAARAMVPALVTAEIEVLLEAAERAGSLGAKPCGAGGGGCVLFVARAGRRDAVVAALRRAGAQILPLRFEPRSYWGDRAPGGTD